MLMKLINIIAALDHTRKLKFSNYVHLPSINKTFEYRYTRVILCNLGEVCIFELGRCISAFGHVRLLILSNYVL